MVRYLMTLNWDGFFRSTILTAFEAYGSALVGITPLEHSADPSHTFSEKNLRTTQRG